MERVKKKYQMIVKKIWILILEE